MAAPIPLRADYDSPTLLALTRRLLVLASIYDGGSRSPAWPPRCDSQAMQWHLDEIAAQVAPAPTPCS